MDRSIVCLLPTLLVGMMIASCGETTMKIGYVCIHSVQKLDCRYQRFTGKEVETMRLGQGERFDLSYDIQVEGGSLLVQFLAPDEKILWESRFDESDVGKAFLILEQDGLYQLVVHGDRSRGGFLIEWRIE